MRWTFKSTHTNHADYGRSHHARQEAPGREHRKAIPRHLLGRQIAAALEKTASFAKNSPSGTSAGAGFAPVSVVGFDTRNFNAEVTLSAQISSAPKNDSAHISV